MGSVEVAAAQRVPETLPLPEYLAVLLFQSVRELLINAAKHAQTTRATVTLEEEWRQIATALLGE